MEIITFISTNNEKFAYAYTLEQAVEIIIDSGSCVTINVYGSVEEYCKKLSELRWLLKESRNEIDIELINERLKFRIVDDAKDMDDTHTVQFHLFPSKLMPKLADYVKFLLKLQATECQKCVLVDDVDCYTSTKTATITSWIYGIFPPDSILTVTSHAASRQFELQKWTDKGIVETVKMEWTNDRMTRISNKHK